MKSDVAPDNPVHAGCVVHENPSCSEDGCEHEHLAVEARWNRALEPRDIGKDDAQDYDHEV